LRLPKAALDKSARSVMLLLTASIHGTATACSEFFDCAVKAAILPQSMSGSTISNSSIGFSDGSRFTK
jgi:hypothetical protein